jgi:ArsR family transcriptional regulator
MNDTDHARILFQKSQLFFAALGDTVRQELLMSMMGHDRLSVRELTARTKLSRPTISHHLKVLKKANIIVEHKEGRQIFYQPQPGENYKAVKELMGIIDEHIKEQELEK